MSTLFEPLDDALGTRSKIRVLRVLCAREGGLSGRETARRADLSSRSALVALAELAELGIVRREVSPGEHRYTLNRRHDLVRHGLERLFQSERRYSDRVFGRLEDLSGRLSQEAPTGIRAAWLFGSAIREEDRPSSDLDLIVVTEDAEGANDLRKALADVRAELAAEFGVDLSPVILTASRLREMETEGASLVRELRRDARRVFGSGVHEVLGD